VVSSATSPPRATRPRRPRRRMRRVHASRSTLLFNNTQPNLQMRGRARARSVRALCACVAQPPHPDTARTKDSTVRHPTRLAVTHARTRRAHPTHTQHNTRTLRNALHASIHPSSLPVFRMSDCFTQSWNCTSARIQIKKRRNKSPGENLIIALFIHMDDLKTRPTDDRPTDRPGVKRVGDRPTTT
jgi:hypothetical protein